MVCWRITLALCGLLLTACGGEKENSAKNMPVPKPAPVGFPIARNAVLSVSLSKDSSFDSTIVLDNAGIDSLFLFLGQVKRSPYKNAVEIAFEKIVPVSENSRRCCVKLDLKSGETEIFRYHDFARFVSADSTVFSYGATTEVDSFFKQRKCWVWRLGETGGCFLRQKRYADSLKNERWKDSIESLP